MQPGQPVTVTVDTYPDAEWHGTVESISPAAAQQFALLPAQNTTGNWVKVVQRISVSSCPWGRHWATCVLRAGMSVKVSIDTGHALAPRAVARLSTTIFGALTGVRQRTAAGSSIGR